MTRDEALRLVKKNIKSENLVKHSLAVESAMRELARELGEDEELWALTGLLHDLDYDQTDMSNHGLVAYDMLKKHNLPEQILLAIRRHPGRAGDTPETALDYALYSVDPLTGLIVASALMHPTRKLKYLDVDFIKRRFKEKRFAAGANRDQIRACEKLGLTLDRFIELTLRAMQGISEQLGL